MESSTLSAPTDTYWTPRWVQDAVFYQIFPDRFAQSPRVPKPNNLEPWDSPPTIYGFKGGDLLGVVEHLDYLQDLGITAIYFCPVFKSTANHRYHTHDYFQVDPILGGNDALKTLLDEAHKRDIRIILDGVFNHASRGFYQFNHILENGGLSPYIDWFSVQSWPLYPYGPAELPPGYAAWWGDRALPEFNTNTPAVREFLWSVGEYWIRQGVDGWRLDVPNEIDDDAFWQEFRRRVKAVNPDAYIVGEIWGDARRWLQGDQFDAVMNYVLTKACLAYFGRRQGLDQSVIARTGLNPVGELDGSGFVQAVDALLHQYPQPATMAQLNLLDSHDTARFISIVQGDESAYRLSVLFVMTFPGAPCIYYGDEIGMSGGATVEEARGGFIWDQSRWNHGLHDYVRACIALRHDLLALRHGTYSVLSSSNETFVALRQCDADLAIVGFNASGESQTVQLELPVPVAHLKNVFGDAQLSNSGGGVYEWVIPPRSGAVATGITG